MWPRRFFANTYYAGRYWPHGFTEVANERGRLTIGDRAIGGLSISDRAVGGVRIGDASVGGLVIGDSL